MEVPVKFSAFALFGLLLALQGCSFEQEDKKEQREIVLGLKFHIGNYILDSIFPNTTDSLFDNYNRYYYVITDRINEINGGAYTYGISPIIGRIYNWDPECYSYIKFTGKSGGGEYTYGNFTFDVDPLGYFDFSEIVYRGGLPYMRFWVNVISGEDQNKSIECYSNIERLSILVHFQFW